MEYNTRLTVAVTGIDNCVGFSEILYELMLS